MAYRYLNPQLKSAADVIKPPEEGVNRQSYGRKLQAMLASRTPTGNIIRLNCLAKALCLDYPYLNAVICCDLDAGELFWKLNAAPRVGFTTNPRPLQRFRDVEIGDIVDVCVSKVSWNGKWVTIESSRMAPKSARSPVTGFCILIAMTMTTTITIAVCVHGTIKLELLLKSNSWYIWEDVCTVWIQIRASVTSLFSRVV